MAGTSEPGLLREAYKVALMERRLVHVYNVYPNPAFHELITLIPCPIARPSVAQPLPLSIYSTKLAISCLRLILTEYQRPSHFPEIRIRRALALFIGCITRIEQLLIPIRPSVGCPLLLPESVRPAILFYQHSSELNKLRLPCISKNEDRTASEGENLL